MADRQSRIDKVILFSYLFLVGMGLIMLYSNVYDGENFVAALGLSTPVGKQLMWVGISIITLIIVYFIDPSFWNKTSIPIYIFAMIMLALVLVVGAEIKGARSWFKFGPVSFQPSELGKLGALLMMANYLSGYKISIKDRNVLLIALGIIGLPMLLILLQSDAGSALVFVSFFLLFYRLGLSPILYTLGIAVTAIIILSIRYNPYLVCLMIGAVTNGVLALLNSKDKKGIILLIASVIGAFFLYSNGELNWAIGLVGIGILYQLGVVLFKKDFDILLVTIVTNALSIGLALVTNYGFESILKPHQKDRINAWLNPEQCDPHGSLYNIIQSKLAIGSGGFSGNGFLKGEMTKLNYVPEQTTDFIFATIGEEFGFVGTSLVILTFATLVMRMIFIAEKAKSKFTFCYAYGLAGIFLIHFFLNIGMTLGVMPVIGIPLPFISKGGSSLLIFTIMIAILLRLEAQERRSY